MTSTTDPTTLMEETNTLSAPVALREIFRGVASAADASWMGRVVTWNSLAKRSCERAGKRQKCQEGTGTNGRRSVNERRTAAAAFPNFTRRVFSRSPNGSCSAARTLRPGQGTPVVVVQLPFGCEGAGDSASASDRRMQNSL